MRSEEFRSWLDLKYPTSQTTVSNRISNCKNVEKYYGDLDEHFLKDRCSSILNDLSYTLDDERNIREQKHLIKIKGNIRNGSATLKLAVKLYVEFRELLAERREEKIVTNKPITASLEKSKEDFSSELQIVLKNFLFNPVVHKDISQLQLDLLEYLQREITSVEWTIEHKPSPNAKDSIDVYGFNNKSELHIVIELDAHRADQVAKKFLSRTSLLIDKNILYVSFCYPGTTSMSKNECYKYFDYCKTISDFIASYSNLKKVYIGFMVS